MSILRPTLGIWAVSTALLLGGCAGGPTLQDIQGAAGSVLGGQQGDLTSSEIARGLKEALTRGSSLVVAQLGAKDGFALDDAIHVPLPRSLQKARNAAKKLGLEKSFDDLELKLNRAAEAATPKAKKLFVAAINDMSVDDARGILKGSDDAATQYFRGKTGAQLANEMRPLVDQALAQVGAVKSFNDLLGRYNRIPGVRKVEADLTGHVVDEGTDGIFYYLAREEKAIRENPLKRSSELLQRVFGSS